MSAQDFVYWLQGFLEMSDAKRLTPKQVEMVKKHLALVLTNVTNPPFTLKTISTDRITIPSISPGTDYGDQTVWPDGWEPSIICSDDVKLC